MIELVHRYRVIYIKISRLVTLALFAYRLEYVYSVAKLIRVQKKDSLYVS